jgi:hypothetical protein
MYTLQEKTRPICHTYPMLSLRMALEHTYLMGSTHSNLSRSYQQRWTEPLLPRKRALNTIHNMMAD